MLTFDRTDLPNYVMGTTPSSRRPIHHDPEIVSLPLMGTLHTAVRNTSYLGGTIITCDIKPTKYNHSINLDSSYKYLTLTIT